MNCLNNFLFLFQLAAQAKRTESNAFNESRTLSQLLGAIIIAFLLVVGFVAYCFARCSFPLTYYHAKYYHLYREMEESEFNDEMRAKVIVSFCSVLYVWSISVASSINGLSYYFIQFWRAFILRVVVL